jgi:uncharacterized protein
MQYRDYGITGEKVSFLGFGGMRFEDPHNIDNSAQTVLRASELGVMYFDTAPTYCDSKSEVIMGEAIKEMKRRRKEFYISTKSFASTPDKLREDLETSLKRLNVDRIDFYHTWCIRVMDNWEERKKGGAVKELLKLKEEGLIKHIAFSTHLAGNEIAQVIEEGHFEGVTLGYSGANFLYREAGIDSAFENGLGVIVMNPLNGGMITQNENVFKFLKVRPNQNLLDGALHFLMNNEKISCAIVGFRNIQDVESAVESVERFKPYKESEMQQIRENLSDEYNKLCTSCMYCKDCPVGIPVWKLVETYNNVILKSNQSVTQRLKLYWGINDPLDKLLARCTKCRKCEESCTQHLPILKRFEELKRIYKEENN